MILRSSPASPLKVQTKPKRNRKRNSIAMQIKCARNIEQFMSQPFQSNVDLASQAAEAQKPELDNVEYLNQIQ